MELGVNIDHVATLRNARGGDEPDVLDAAIIAQRAGASAITIHLREDRRHIKDSDLDLIKKNIKTNINLEMAATGEMQQIAIANRPYSCCIVPEKRQEVTTEGGLDVHGQEEYIRDFIKPLHQAGIVVSLFIDPDEKQIFSAHKCYADFIELHTGAYANAFGTECEKEEFEKLKTAAAPAQNLGLKVNAGHGLNYQNVHRMHEIEGLIELNIGHSIISRAVFVGLEQAIEEMKDLII